MSKNFYANEEGLSAIDSKPLVMEAKDVVSSKRKFSIKHPIMLILLFILILLGAYFTWKIFMKQQSGDVPKTNQAQLEASEALMKSYINLEPLMINLTNEDKKHSIYLRLSVVLQSGSENEAKVVQSKIPVIVDSFQLFLSGLRPADFGGTGITVLLKEELTKRVNKIIAPLVIKDLLFKEIVVN